MTCNECKMRDMCVTICPDMEKYLSEFHRYRRELPLGDHELVFLLEDSLRANRAQYIDRHSEYLEELKRRLKLLWPWEREMIEMHYLKGIPVRKIARKLGVTTRAANYQIREVLEKLRGKGPEKRPEKDADHPRLKPQKPHFKK